MNDKTFTFVGGGNMASALFTGLLSNNIKANQINVIEPNKDKLDLIQKKYALNAFPSATVDSLSCDYLFLCVKPQVMQEVCNDLSTKISLSKTIILTVAAGITTENIKKWLNTDNTVIRCMPNTPALIGIGATGLYTKETLSKTDKKTINTLFSSIGISIWTNTENDIDTVTAVSGSGPAYFFRMIEAMKESATEMGLDENDAKDLIIQTALGAAQMAKDSSLSIQQLRENVTSKGGTTAAALDSLTKNDFNLIINKAIRAAQQRSIELSKL